MTNKNPINWYEIPTTDLDRATRFYEEMLGVTLKREVFAGTPLAIFARAEEGGVAGALSADARRPSGQGTLVFLDARGDLDGALARAVRAGGRVAVPRTELGPVGSIAQIVDTEGNTVGLHQPARA